MAPGSIFEAKVVRTSALNQLTMEPWLSWTIKNNKSACCFPIVGVTTTLKSKSTCIDAVAKLMPVVVVGDTPQILSPPNDYLVEYLSTQRQAEKFPEFDQVLPVNSSARKNMGYLRAIQIGACRIWDFDDESHLLPDTESFFKQLIAGAKPQLHSVLQMTSPGNFVNPYLLYGSPVFIWPRGYPLEEVNGREFPRIERGDNELKVDVVQFLQETDPDVDTNWGLEYATELPLKWAPNEAITNELIAISPNKWSPFNSQATLLSSRAALIALLPHTVSGRVADIWRSYCMQYLMKHFTDGPGLLAFCGTTVDHRRNSFSSLADQEAESQMRGQTQSLIHYLNGRPIVRLDLLQELIVLTDDLYQRGYIEREDVEKAIIWSKLVFGLTGLEPVQLTRNKTHYEVLSSAPEAFELANVVAVVHINSGMRRLIPSWMALHGYKFAAVRFYVPSVDNYCPAISGIQPWCISNDTRGFFAYESTVHTIETLIGRRSSLGYTKVKVENFTYDGIYFLHDDAIWHHHCVSLDRQFSNRMCAGSTSQAPFARAANMTKGHPWFWMATKWGLSACKTVEKLLNASVDFYVASGDHYYLARDHMLTFAKIGRLMRETGLFLELAVPTIFQSFLPIHEVEATKVLTYWDHRRRSNGTSMSKDFCSSNLYSWAHPVKLSKFEGVVAHTRC